MKNYMVTLHARGTFEMEVKAKSVEEAIGMAKEAVDTGNFDLDDYTHEEAVGE